MRHHHPAALMKAIRHDLLLVLPLGTMLLAVWAGVITLQDPPYLGLELLSNGTVHLVDPQGPAADAGVRLGDHIDEVNGRPLLAHFSLVAGQAVDDVIVLTGQRGSEAVTFELIPGEVTTREMIFSVERLFVGVIFILVGLAIWLVRPGAHAARLFLVFSQVMGGMLVAEILDPVIPWMSVFTDFTRYLVGPLLLHFFATFPTPVPEPLRTRLLVGVYGAYGLVALAFGAGLLFNLDLYATGIWMAPRVIEVVIGALVVAVLLRPQPAASLNAHRWRGILVAGMLLGITPVMITLMSMVVSGGRPVVPYEWTVPALALTPLSYGYAVYKSELSRAGFVLNRSLVYFLLTGMLLGAYALAYLALESVFGAERGWGYLVAGVLIVVVGSTLFVPIRTMLQQWVDRLFYGGWYDYRSFVQAATGELSRFTDIGDLAGHLRDAAQTMRFKSGALLWPRRGRFHPIGAYGFEPEDVLKLKIPVDGPIATVLRRHARPCTSEELRDGVEWVACSEPERAALTAASTAHWIPLVSRGTLRSILVAGPRQGDADLDPEDQAILATLSTHAAIACDNIALLESLQERLLEVEQVRDELAEAQTRLSEGREEERMHLARELHDGPIQDLYAVLHEAEMLLDEDDRTRQERLRAWRETVQRVAATLRDVCIDLRPPLLTDFGLEVTMRSHAARFREVHPNIRVQFDLTPIGEVLPERIQLALFRIYQEALNNAFQHGKAKQVCVRFEADAERIVLEIEDDGFGFVVPKRWIEFARKGHLGLLGIAERAASIGGRLAVESEPGGGTRLRVEAARPTEQEEPDQTIHQKTS